MPDSSQNRSALRQYQDRQLNAGWRIQIIPHDDRSRPMVVKGSIIAPIGALMFLIGFVLLWRGNRTTGFWLAGLGWPLGLLGIWITARRNRKGWKEVFAQCVDREVRGAGKDQWFWRIVCEFDYDGKAYRVTPKEYWRSFTSEKSVQKFLAHYITPNGKCRLFINPKNPLETELTVGGIVDKLLH